MRTLAIFLAPLLAISFATLVAAQDQMTDTEAGTEFVCPVGGETFRQNVEMIYYPLESLPNGSALGGQMSDRGVPVCPGNGLVLPPAYDGEEGSPEAFTAYTTDEIALLPALIASAEYKALKGEPRYWRLYWLAGKLGRPAVQRFHLLQHVSWLGDTPEAHRRNVGHMVAEADALIEAFPPGYSRTMAKFYVANAMRELGRFDEADARLAQLLTEREAEWALIKASEPPPNPHFETDEDRMGDGVADRIIDLREAIAANDDDPAPVSMMGERAANSTCGDLDDAFPPATETTKRGCAARKAERDGWSRAYDERQALESDPARLAELCAADRPSGGVENACYWAQRKRERTVREAQAEQLLKKPELLDAQCKAVIIPSRYSTPKTAIGKACQDRADDLRSAKETEYAKKFAKDAGLYDRLCTMQYPEHVSNDPLEAACASEQSNRHIAQYDRDRKAVAALSGAEIAARCEALEEAERDPANQPGAVPTVSEPDALRYKCADLKMAREKAEREAWEADPAKLAEACKTAARVRYDGTVLELLCRDIEAARIEAAAQFLAANHSKLVSSCKTTPHRERGEILARACDGYLKCIVAPAEIDTNEKAYDPYRPVDEEGREVADGKPVRYCFQTLEEADQFDANHQIFARTPAEIEAQLQARARVRKEHEDEVAKAMKKI